MWEIQPRFKELHRKFLRYSSIGLGLFLLWFIWWNWSMPSVRALGYSKLSMATQLFTRDGVLIGTFYQGENRVAVRMTEIPKSLQTAIVASEDPAFYDHSGVMMSKWFSSSSSSTLTQRLARNLIEQNGGRWLKLITRIEEIYLAVFLERFYSKDELICHYLNHVSFSGNTFGISQAALHFFNKKPKDLTVTESAMLVGLLKAPSFYNPLKYPERAQNRRNEVLKRMSSLGFIKKNDLEKAQKLPLVLNRGKIQNQELQFNNQVSIAPYFREHLRKWLKKWAKEKGYDIYHDGLKVYTTLDSRLQMHADSAMRAHLMKHQSYLDREFQYYGKPWEKDSSILIYAMKRSHRYQSLKKEGLSEKQIRMSFKEPHQMRLFSWKSANNTIDTTLTPWDSLKYYAGFLHPGVLTLDPHNGHVLAWVGGIDYNFFQYDHVGMGKRQVGSTFKPYVYSAAFESGMKPCDKIPNQPIGIKTREGDIWTPRNADFNTGPDTSIRCGIANSLNIIAARVTNKIGPEKVVEYAHKMGVQTALDPVPSICLGPIDLSMTEMAVGFSCFPNFGKKVDMMFVTTIEDHHGNIIESFTPKIQEAISEETAFTMIQMLQAVVNEGTAGELRYMYDIPYNLEVGGKTGTSQNHSDAWFMGFTKQMVTAVWVGSDDPRVHFQSMDFGQGSAMAMPIWGRYMKMAYTDSILNIPIEKFEKPKTGTYYFCQQCYGVKDTTKKDSLVFVPDSTLIIKPDSNSYPPIDLDIE